MKRRVHSSARNRRLTFPMVALLAIVGFLFFSVADSPAQAASLTRFEESDGRLAYQGTWKTSVSSAFSARTLRSSPTSGSAVTVRFEGTSLNMVARTGPNYGKVRLTIDGGTSVLVDLYSRFSSSKRTVYSTGTLRSGTHSVKIEWTGQRNSRATGSTVNLDAFDINGTVLDATVSPPTTATSSTTTAPPTTVGSTTTTVRVTTTTTASTTTTTVPRTTTTLARTTTTTAPTTTSSTVASNYTLSSPISLRSGAFVTSKLFQAGSWYDDVQGIWGSGINGATLDHIRFENLTCGAKIGTGSQSYNMAWNDVVARGCFGAFFLANVSDSTLSNMDLECYYAPNAQSGSKNHVIYLERGLHNVNFYNVKMTGGSSWPLHLYNYESQSQPSDNILFDGLDVDCQVGAIVISEGFSKVTMRNVKARAGNGWPVFRAYGAARDVVIENFEAWGPGPLVDKASGLANPVNWIFRNGVYHGPSLGSVPGVTFENVRLEP